MLSQRNGRPEIRRSRARLQIPMSLNGIVPRGSLLRFSMDKVFQKVAVPVQVFQFMCFNGAMSQLRFSADLAKNRMRRLAPISASIM